MRGSVAGAIATHMQTCAVPSRYEGIREGLGRIGLYDRAAASRMASVKEHESRTDTFARWSLLRDGAPRRLAAKPHCLGPTVVSDQSVSADSTRFTPAPMSDVGAR
jgi:hypothetical protein